ncbi:hypothetical protein BGZ98_003706 [Dissophora globulifera]|nr:hypothetical protein BGZ98_003706 [Dissophora globulifera]
MKIDYDRKLAIDKNRLDKNYCTGDHVVVHNYADKKFDIKWYGPLEVVQVAPLSTYQLGWTDGVIKKDLVYKDRLKLVHSIEGKWPSKPWHRADTSMEEDELNEEERPRTLAEYVVENNRAMARQQK